MALFGAGVAGHDERAGRVIEATEIVVVLPTGEGFTTSSVVDIDVSHDGRVVADLDRRELVVPVRHKSFDIRIEGDVFRANIIGIHEEFDCFLGVVPDVTGDDA